MNLKTISVAGMNELRVLAIWASGIAKVDVSCLEFMELVICGFWYGGGNDDRQVVTARNGVVKRVFNLHGTE